MNSHIRELRDEGASLTKSPLHFHDDGNLYIEVIATL